MCIGTVLVFFHGAWDDLSFVGVWACDLKKGLGNG
jgi:hypothetical protein